MTMRVSVPLITKTMKVLESHDFSVVKKKLSSTYDMDDVVLIIEELKRFLALKVFENDHNAEKLSPSYIVDQAWHSLILDPLSYCLLCQKLSNNKTDPVDYIIGHNQHGGGDNSLQKKRYKANLKLYKEYFDIDAPDMIWPTNENPVTNQLTQMNERKRLRTSSSSSPSSNSFGCQTDADLDEIEDDIPWCAVSLAWQQTDENNYKLNGDTLKAVTSNEMEYIELFIKTHGECDYLIKVKPSTPAIAIFELVAKFLNNNGTGVKKPSHIMTVNTFCFFYNDHLIKVSDFSFRDGIEMKGSELDVKNLTCSQLNLQSGFIWELRYYMRGC